MLEELLKKPRRWNARWIWVPGSGAESNVYAYFRKEFKLNRPPRGFKLFITAETYYRLFINGQLIGQGPPLSQPFFKYYDEREVDEQLREGENCIAVVVYYVGKVREGIDPSRGGLLLELVDGEGRTALGSGSDWRCLRSPAHTRNTFAFRMNYAFPYQEVFDARREPEGWKEIGFDDSSWEQAVVVNEGGVSERPPGAMPWMRLVPRDIPFMREEPLLPERIERIDENLELANRTRPEDLSIALSMPGQPLRYSRVEGAENLLKGKGEAVFQCSTEHLKGVFDGIYDPSILLDFGRVVTGHIEIKLKGVEGGIVDIGYAERLIDGHFNNALEGQFADRFIMREGEQTFRSFAWRGFRYVKLRFRSCFKPVVVRSLRAIITTYPYEERGRFESEDETLNAVFDICRYTVKLCSNDFLMDTPWREQGQWLGDVAAVTIPTIYACFGDTLLPGKFLRQSAANQLPTGLLANVTNVATLNWRNAFPDYSLWWVIALWNHYLYTGDEEWVHAYYPEALKIIRFHMGYVNERGLIENIPEPPFIDWAPVDRRGECAALNAIFYGALESFAEMARLKGDRRSVEEAETVMGLMRESFQRRFFDPDRGCFIDALIDGVPSSKVSEHTNAAAIRWGLCDEETARTVIRNIWEEGNVKPIEAQPFFCSVVLEALDRAGRFDLALRIIKERWGGRMVGRNMRSTLEEWYQNGSWRSGSFSGFLRSCSHAWSAYPAKFLIWNLIGFEITGPGCQRVKINPKETPFNYSVVCPTPLGEVKVSRQGGRVRVETPDLMQVEQPQVA